MRFELRGRSQTTFTKQGMEVVLKCPLFVKRSYHKKCHLRGVGGQKSQNLVNVVYERPLRVVQYATVAMHSGPEELSFVHKQSFVILVSVWL